MHDTWVAAVASVSGKIVYDLNAYIDYRIHESNTVGVNAGTIHNRIYKLKKYFCDNNSRYGRSKLAKELIEISDKSLDFDVVNDFSCARFKRIALLKNDKVKKDCTEKRFLFLLKVFFRWI